MDSTLDFEEQLTAGYKSCHVLWWLRSRLDVLDAADTLGLLVQILQGKASSWQQQRQDEIRGMMDWYGIGDWPRTQQWLEFLTECPGRMQVALFSFSPPDRMVELEERVSSLEGNERVGNLEGV